MNKIDEPTYIPGEMKDDADAPLVTFTTGEMKDLREIESFLNHPMTVSSRLYSIRRSEENTAFEAMTELQAETS